MIKKLLLPLGLIFLFLSLVLNLHLFRKLSKNSTGLKVIKVLDGDTFVIEPNQSIRLADIDAPEQNFCLGKEAKKRLEELILGKRVTLEESGIDKFRRILALVYINGTFVNKLMLEDGLGRYDCTYTSKDKELKEAAHQAEKAKIGVFSSECTQIIPPDPKCAIKGNIEKHYGEKIYHFPGCSGYNVVIVEKDRGEDWFCSESEALSVGFRKSDQCYGKSYSP